MAIRFQLNVSIPMRDGVLIRATLYLPSSADDEPVPAIFTLTPYGSDTYHARAKYFAEHGYGFVIADCRGRGNSQGEFVPYFTDGADAYDIAEWLSVQSWCCGSLSMHGGSWQGFNQWQALKHRQTRLATIVPVASPYLQTDFPAVNNIFQTDAIHLLALVSGKSANWNLYLDANPWRDRLVEGFQKAIRFQELDKFLGLPSTTFQEWIRHPVQDEYWDAAALTEADYRSIRVPILTITGQYDDDQRGALRYYDEHERFGDPTTVTRHYLVIGPWDHFGTSTPRQIYDGVDFGDQSLVDLNELHLEWYDWHLRGGARPAFLRDRVSYYVLVANEWRYAPTLKSIAKRFLTLQLATKTEKGGSLLSGLRAYPNARFEYDPADVDSTSADASPYCIRNRLDSVASQGIGLEYESEPFSADLTLAGRPYCELYLSIDVPDTDLRVLLFEISQDGSSILLGHDSIRARHRTSLREEKLLNCSDPLPYGFQLGFIARRVKEGQRLRLIVTCVNEPWSQKNYNSGGTVSLESIDDAEVAHITLVSDETRLSYLALPVGEDIA